MENNLFKVASKVARPISLVSIAIIAVYLIFRLILNLDIFSSLSEQHTFALVSLVANRIFTLALVTLVFGIIAYAYVAFLSRKNPQNKLHIIGNVFDDEGRPVKDAFIQVDGVDRRKLTDESGWFQIEVNEQSSWTVRAIKDNATSRITVHKDYISAPINLNLSGMQFDNAKKSQLQREATAGLKVVDVSIIDDLDKISTFRKTWLKEKGDVLKEKGRFPIIDVKLRNTSSEPIFVKLITFDVKQIDAVRNPFSPLAQPSSWEYNVLLSAADSDNSKTIPTSQVLRPKDVDRFIIVMGTDGFNLRSITYEFSMTLHYNENDSIKVSDLKVSMYPPIWLEPDKEASAVKFI